MSFFPGVTQVWTGRVELKRVTSARVSSFYFSSFDRFFFFLVEISINTHNLVWIEITPEISETRQGNLKDTRERQKNIRIKSSEANFQRCLMSFGSLYG